MTSPIDAFTIRFSNEQYSPALRVDPRENGQRIIETFGLIYPRPTIFITGGASNMTDDDIVRTREIMNLGIAYFANKYNISVVDGGTEAGVMQMLGESRRRNNYKFPLIGVAPVHKVSYPGWRDNTTSVRLEDGHSHFVLVNADEWGKESQMIVNLTRAIAAKQRPMMGILINGGKIAERDVYLATAKGDFPIPMLVVDGSGRTADTISTAFRTQSTDSKVIRAIIEGGDIRITALYDGVPALLEQLEAHFQSLQKED